MYECMWSTNTHIYTHAHIHRGGPVYVSRPDGLQRFSERLGRRAVCPETLWGLFSSSERLLNKSEFVTVAGGQQGGINTHQCRCLSIYSHPWESLLCSVSNPMSGDPHLAGPILVGGFTWAPLKSTHLSPSALVFFRQWITVTLFFFIAVAKNKHKDSHLAEQQKRDKNKQLFLEVLFHYK